MLHKEPSQLWGLEYQDPLTHFFFNITFLSEVYRKTEERSIRIRDKIRVIREQVMNID